MNGYAFIFVKVAAPAVLSRESAQKHQQNSGKSGSAHSLSEHFCNWLVEEYLNDFAKPGIICLLFSHQTSLMFKNPHKSLGVPLAQNSHLFNSSAYCLYNSEYNFKANLADARGRSTKVYCVL